MCRMLGIAGVPPLPLKEALNAFYPLCTKGCVEENMEPGHSDGWGISGYSGGRAVYFARDARPAEACKAEYDVAVSRAVASGPSLLVAHLRKTSGSEITISNTHPFHYQDWIFVHNGTIFGATASFPLISATPQGTTDSERYFLWLYEQILGEPDPTRTMVDVLKKSREGLVYSSLSFILTDGKRMWAYREYGDKRLEKGETVAGRARYYTLHLATLPGAVIACSEPLAGIQAEWKPLEQRTLAVFVPQAPVPQLIRV